jgi:hypothetical protein
MTNLFTRKHYEWLVEMTLILDFTESQIAELIVILRPTNYNFNEALFRQRCEFLHKIDRIGDESK